MWWQYILVFLGALLFDIVPFPFPPAFTIMFSLLVIFHLKIWPVIVIGVAGSVLGRYILTLYTPLIADKYIKKSKNEDVQFLGKKMKENRLTGQIIVLAYSLLPLPTTPLFLAAGMAKLEVQYIIPAFLIGKFTSDTIVLHAGKYALENVHDILKDVLSFKSIASLSLSVFLIFCILFIDWRSLIQKNKLVWKFKIWRQGTTRGNRSDK
jgi:membrane protein YqaA with SNARE-associated domain